ncbi:hypothetical protein BC831DRAFT_31745 [Entophlyctis helioformis]|nr:hypothetical protein BC831DRAFT_31745 [Entophlyctis helioformis]
MVRCLCCAAQRPVRPPCPRRPRPWPRQQPRGWDASPPVHPIPSHPVHCFSGAASIPSIPSHPLGLASLAGRATRFFSESSRVDSGWPCGRPLLRSPSAMFLRNSSLSGASTPASSTARLAACPVGPPSPPPSSCLCSTRLPRRLSRRLAGLSGRRGIYVLDERGDVVLLLPVCLDSGCASPALRFWTPCCCLDDHRRLMLFSGLAMRLLANTP